jgi:hypothetical protein
MSRRPGLGLTTPARDGWRRRERWSRKSHMPARALIEQTQVINEFGGLDENEN